MTDHVDLRLGWRCSARANTRTGSSGGAGRRSTVTQTCVSAERVSQKKEGLLPVGSRSFCPNSGSGLCGRRQVGRGDSERQRRSPDPSIDRRVHLWKADPPGEYSLIQSRGYHLRELVHRISDECSLYSENVHNGHMWNCTGGNILICTPGRLESLLSVDTGLGEKERWEAGRIATGVKSLEWLVLDEADRLLELGYKRSCAALLIQRLAICILDDMILYSAFSRVYNPSNFYTSYCKNSSRLS